MKHRLLLLQLGLLLLAACNSDVAAPPDSDQKPTAAAAGFDQKLLRRTVMHDGIEREFFVHVPVATNTDGLLPVVVAIHGYTSTATGFAAHHGLNAHADQNGYIVVYPQGSHFMANTPGAGAYRVTSWNDLAANQPETAAGPHCTDESTRYPRPPECTEFSRCAWTSCHDDLGFIEQVFDVMQSEFMSDPQRFYVLGVSNGAMMAITVACRMSDRIAAVAPIIGQLAPGYACAPDKPVPMLHLYGEQDDTVRFDGQPAGDGFIYTSAAETARIWAEALACDMQSVAADSGRATAAGVSCTAYQNCGVPGQRVLSCADADGAHQWPAQGVSGIPATCVTAEQYESMPGQARCQTGDGTRNDAGMDLIWHFFRKYRSASVSSADQAP